MIFCETALIYGLELLAAVDTLFSLRDCARGKNVTIYVDNSDTKDSLVRGFPPTKIITFPSQIFWAFAQCSGDRFWFEQVPSDRNIADLPTRLAQLPTNTKAMLPFSILNILKKWVTETRKKGECFLFTNGPAACNENNPLLRGL